MSVKNKFRMFLRGSVYWVQDNDTGKQETLRTKNRAEAERLLNARNEAHRQPIINLQIARAYLMVADKDAAKRTWSAVMAEILMLKRGETLRRWQIAVNDKAFSDLRDLPILETRAYHFYHAIEKGKVSTNIYLRRIQNFALRKNWLPVAVITKDDWPPFEFKKKRAITLAEHLAIIARERNSERKAFYELAWLLGASQSDLASLEAENVNWRKKVIAYVRKKSRERAFISFGKEVERILIELPSTGPLFPYLRGVRASDRATEFKQRCKGLGIQGVTLHSYRYAWAERARRAGYPQRFAQEALGHNSEAVHRAYASNAEVVIPTLESFEAQAALRSADAASE